MLELLADVGDGGTQSELLMGVARRGQPRGLLLLESVGQSHPDKAVAKLAPKETFRLRSKLASRGRP